MNTKDETIYRVIAHIVTKFDDAHKDRVIDVLCAEIADSDQEYHEADTASGWRERLSRHQSILVPQDDTERELYERYRAACDAAKDEADALCCAKSAAAWEPYQDAVRAHRVTLAADSLTSIPATLAAAKTVRPEPPVKQGEEKRG